ncbi:MAG: PASTA domain-containing protein [Gemmatimonadetes bacterium]|nr:PASTA domain-containing protein [Gemmatimonadota bacterium]
MSRRGLGLPLPKTVPGRRRLTATLVVLGAGLTGYLTTCIAYPRPLFGRDHAVARVVGLPVSEAEQQLAAQGFKVEIEGEEPDPEVPAGAVLAQDPPPDLVVPEGTIVTLTRSGGPSPVPVPDVIEFETELATRVVLAAGLRLGDVDSVPSATPAGVVVATRPAAGTMVPGSTIDLVVSQGPVAVEVPNVVGLTRAQATARLAAAGFRLGRAIRAEGRRGDPNIVLEQRPAGGERTTPGSRVDLIFGENP